MATLTGKLVADTYKALLKLIDNDILTASEKQISDGFGQGSNVFIDQNGFLRASQYKVTGGNSSQFLKGDGSLDSNTYLSLAAANALYLPIGSTTSAIAEGSRLYFTTARVLNTTLAGFVATAGTVTAADTILTAIDKIWWNIVNGGGGGGGYVPYTGATQNLNLGTYGLLGDFVQFNVSNSAVPTAVGTMSWNNTDGTADLKLKGGNVTLQIGQEEVVRVVNKTGAALLEANYHAVYISGAQGQRLKVDLALAVTDGTSAGTIGIVTETIANNQEGFVTSSGLVNEINTTGSLQGETWADGDVLYLSPTIAGDITNVKPLAPDHTVIIGFVVYAHAIHGKIYVKVDNGYEIEELHDVQVIDRTDTDILQWYEDDLVWRNIQFATALDNAGGIIGLGDINYVPRFDGTNSISNSRIFDDLDNVIIGGTVGIIPNPFGSADMLTVLNGNIAIEGAYSYRIDTHQILKRTNATGEFRIGTNVIGDFITLYAGTSERARLTAAGYLGVGLTAPSSMIHAKDSTAYGKIIIDNTGLTGGGSFSARQNGTETAIFGVSGSWQANTTSDAAIVATRGGQGIKFYTNGSTTAKGGIDSVGNSFIGQLPAYYTGATNFIVQGISAAAMIGVTHMDNSIKGIFSTLNSGVSFGSYTPHPVIFRTDDIESARIASDGKWLIGTATNDNVNLVQINGSVIATTLKKSGGTSIQFLKADGSVTTLTASAQGLDYDSATGDFYITTGYVIPLITTTTNWDTAYTNRITSLTTTGSSGNATLISNVLNIPTITLSGIGGQPISANLTSLSSLSYVSGSFVKMTASGTFTLDTNTYYLASNPSNFIALTALSSSATGLTYTNTTGVFSLTAGYVIPTTTSATNWDTAYTNRITSATAPLSITTNVISISQATTSTNGYLSSTDWNTFNGKQAALGFTPVTNARTLTINGTTYDLTADRTWTISTGISTLTTLGTSGPATLVGSTLNVPNYSAGSSAVRNVSTFTATSGQTTFTIIGGYTVGLIDVFINGARLSTADYTATNSSTVVLGTGAVLNDIVDVVNYTATFTAGISGTGTANYITKWTGSATVNSSIIYDNGSQIGIGTTSNLNFGVAGVVGISVGGSTAYGGMQIRNTTGNLEIFVGGDGATDTFIRNNMNGNLRFGTNGGEKMRITSTGLIGIGSTSPNYNLHINDSGTGGIIQFTSSVTGTTSSDGFLIGLGGAADALILNRENTSMLFYTNNTERMRIDNTGATTFKGTSGAYIVTADITDTTGSSRFRTTSTGGNYNDLISYSASHPSRPNQAWIGGDGNTLTLVFQTGGVERMRIGSNNYVGINTSSPTQFLHILNTSNTWGEFIQMTGSGNKYGYLAEIQGQAPYNQNSVLYYGGDYTSARFMVYSNGGIANFQGNNVNLSDISVKKDIIPIESYWNKFKAINIVKFKYKDQDQLDNDYTIGVIAQELEKVAPEFVNTDGWNQRVNTHKILKSVYSADLHHATIKVLQETMAKVENLENEIAYLKAK